MIILKGICDDNQHLPTEKFFSRRNKVYMKNVKVDGELLSIVIKEHPNEKKAEEEVNILKYLYEKQVKVPLCYGRFENKVCTKYLAGILLNQLVDNGNKYGYNWINELAKWYAAFHGTTLNDEGKALLKLDNNLRNFMLYEDVIYSFDFEGPVYGFPAQDIGECCAYILTNTPAFTEEKYYIIRNLIIKYMELSKLNIFDEIKYEIEHNLHKICQYRPKQQDEILAHLPQIQLFALN